MKWLSKSMSKLDYFSKHIYRNSKLLLKRSSERRIEVGDRKSVDQLHLLLLLSVSVYKQLFMSKSMVLVELAEARFVGTERAASYKN